MSQLPISRLPIMDEQDASGQTAEIFDEIRREMELPFVPNIMRATSTSTGALSATWHALHNIFMKGTLPSSLSSMILYSIAAAKDCQYCSSVHKLTCKTLGIDEQTLEALATDFEALTPRRVQEIIKFAQKCSLAPKSLTEADYDKVRDEGLSEEELMEVIALAALGNYLDTLADGMKIEVDGAISQALQG